MLAEKELDKLIQRINQGDTKALDHLFPLVYEELRKSAHLLRRRFQKQETLNTTALVHEAYFKLAKADLSQLQNKEHFFNLASKAIRQILVNACQKQRTQKRKKNQPHLPIEDLEEQLNFSEDTRDAILQIHDALQVLEKQQPHYGKIVECRFFAGLSIDETAQVLGTSPSTVKRKWSMAKTWLHMQLTPNMAY
ncbi:ECF-type sigma factor [Marinoscillum furvescens]|uniref:RNA polymerase ECF family sigma subunit n=1 Tax=Marinoscillum furvescens DSM 4134 TaxID=1122208 RepID=A0A3D9L3N1_MARFU|nr:ECF-type sigma factor [Marinoscillum furvescens]RED99410.1 RNA polymerase ECF family sigma subunit [Marinoscillum furvescens DSM 4134]